ncbi:aminoglycoside phosphotransferase family protein [uncultured Nocardioides sp.]|uniref:aminoglycoside phosphotransferase family protein n=1 Tax=uncultured Nocardioides sp. TaxID=198441 RepID=UPI002632BEDA|nr:aminoglycoside phosphotransferase family protein [uncultured Nocardioides sp.]
MSAVPLPAEVLAFAARGPEWAAYVERLPRLVRELTDEWGLVVDGEPMSGFGSLVVPVLRDGSAAVLKLAFPDDEGEHEALGLQRWGGSGAVRLLSADPHRSALLLERLHPVDLDSLPVLDACEVVAALYARLHVPALPQLRPLTSYVARWTEQLAALPRDAPLPHRLGQQAVALGREFAIDEQSTGVLIHADLHYQNVLAADREPWLVIDPKPVSGDPHYEPAPMLWNRWDEVVASSDVRTAVRRRFHTLVDASGLDEDRARDWVVVRMLHNALWELEDHPDTPDRDYLTMCVAIAKAVQD